MTERAGTVGFAPDHALKLLPHSTGFLGQLAESCLDLFLRWQFVHDTRKELIHLLTYRLLTQQRKQRPCQSSLT